MKPIQAWIGLGSNLENRRRLLEQALQQLGKQPDLHLRAVSSAWETSPVGPVAQGAYLNAVAVVNTSLEAHPLLYVLLKIEQRLGRVRNQRWGPRTIDLDLLIYGDTIIDKPGIDKPGLTLPHPYFAERRFVLTPMLEIASGLRHPASGQRLVQALRELPEGEEQVTPAGPLRLPTTLLKNQQVRRHGSASTNRTESCHGLPSQDR